MDKMRIALKKTEDTKYVGHLDFGRAVERALRRAKLPVAYSEGFNPHMRLSFGPALGVGVASEAEHVDVELAGPSDAESFSRALSAQLPPGLALVGAHPPGSSAALTAVLNLARYQAVVQVEPDAEKLRAARAAAAALRDASAVSFVRRSPKGEKSLDIKEYLVGDVAVGTGPDGITVDFWLRMKASGAVKPQELLAVLQGRFGLPAGHAAFRRTALRAETDKGIRDPFEI